MKPTNKRGVTATQAFTALLLLAGWAAMLTGVWLLSKPASLIVMGAVLVLGGAERLRASGGGRK